MFEASISNESLEQLPITTFGGKIVLVNDVHTAEAAVEHLMTEKVLGFDTETRPSFAKGKKNKVALLQLSGTDTAYLFRLVDTGLPQPVAHLLENEKILKIGAAIKEDIAALTRLSHFTPKGFVDLQKLVSQFNIHDKSVKKMAAIVLKVRISKSQQLSNWESGEYTDAQKQYAATDAWVCREIYLTLKQQERNYHHS